MSYTFDRWDSQYLYADDTTVTDLTNSTMSAWFYCTDSNNFQGVLGYQDKDVADHRIVLACYANVAGDPVRIFTQNSAGNTAEDTTTGISFSTWQHVAARFSSSDVMIPYLDGGNAPAGDTARQPSGIDRVSIGAFADSTVSGYFDGQLAHVAFWNTELTVAQITMLSQGFLPIHVQPQNLVSYWPLQNDANDIISGVNLTATGDVGSPSVSSNNPPVITVMPSRFAMPGSTAAGGVAPTGNLAGPLVGPLGGIAS